MKLLPFLIFFIVTVGIAQAAKDREFTSKTLHLTFETSADAHKWSLRNLGLKEWLDAVSKPEWTALHSSESGEFYFAVFRSGNHLIFCDNDRKDAYRRTATSLKATNDAIGFAVAERPNMWTTLKWNVVNPSGGGTSGQRIYATWKIKDGFSGEILLEYNIGNEGMPFRKVLNLPISWTNKQHK